MPVNYTLPPWLTQHADPAAEYNANMRQAAQLTAQMAMEQQRLSQQAAMTSMEIGARQEQAQKEADLKRQELMISKARAEAEQGLRRQQLQAAQDRVALSAQTAARKFAAQQAFQAEIGDGSDPEKVSRAMLKYGAAMGAPGAAMAAATRASSSKPAYMPANLQANSLLDPNTQQPIPGAYVYPSPTGKGPTVHWSKDQTGGLTQEDRSTLHELDLEQATIMKDPMNVVHQKKNDAEWKAIQTRLAEIQAEKERILPALKKGGTSTASTGGKQKQFKDKSGKTWVYTGTAADPKSDTNPDHWQQL